MQKNQRRKLGIYKSIKNYPYYTFEDQSYSQFMLSLMNLLEVRCFVKGELIAEEMDESLEILFVELGIYEVGYEINKKLFFERHFGPSTVIGGFQVCYGRRHDFTYRAYQKMKCLAIRKQKFLLLVEKFPQLKYKIK